MANVFQDFNITNIRDFQIVILGLPEILDFFLSGQVFAAIDVASMLLQSF